MKIVVIDTETSGLSERDQVVELASVRVWEHPPGWIQGEWWTRIVRPSCPVSAAARGIHHITDEDLANAQTMEVLLGIDVDVPFLGDDVVMVAHNLDFDVRMLLQSGLLREMLPPRMICTYRCALHLFPDEESHKNQSLRYSLNLNVPVVDGFPPHRALPDAVTTASILIKMLENKSVDDLIHLTTEPVILRRVPFGKSRGKPWADMDEGFLKWILSPGKSFEPDIVRTAQHYLNLKAGSDVNSLSSM